MPPKPVVQVVVKDVDTSWIHIGDKVWVELKTNEQAADDCFKAANVTRISGQDIGVVYDNKKEETVKAALLYASNSYAKLPEGFTDMVEMENLSEAELLYNLEVRFQVDQIFSYVGPTLIVINPFQNVSHLYKPQLLKEFQASVRNLTFEHANFPPHVWALSAASITYLNINQKNQAIVISGESGAGKTESAKIAMKFLTAMNDSDKKEGAAPSDQPSIEDKILACNPILEAFGNAKTVRNDNSSRFGKYVSLLIKKGGDQKILGATIANYLLEKSRICGQSQGERNYHIFYHLFKGAPQKDLERLHLVAADGKSIMESLEYVNKSGCYEVPTVNDKELYDEVSQSFRTMKFSDDEIKSVWVIVACSLHLGNLVFDDSVLSDTEPCGYKNEIQLKYVSELLEVNHEELSKAIRYKTRVVAGTVIESPLSKIDCVTARDSLAKELFNKLFNWLVKRLNYTVMPPEFMEDGADINALGNQYCHIGLLDIFGFEIFKINSIEQLCINYTNEKLQQLYIFYVFKAEEKVFIGEGLADYLGELNFQDNQPVIDLLDLHPTGIFQLIDESCSVNTTDEALCKKILTNHAKNAKIGAPRMARMQFIVHHTASSVEYNTDGFRFKNRDELGEPIEQALFKSKFKQIPRVYKCLCGNEQEVVEEKKAKGKNDKFLGAKFRMQIKELMTELQSCECHFVRCIKPNEKKVKRLMQQYMTLQQIKCMGILDTIKVRKESYPIRRLYKQFYERYGELCQKHSTKSFIEHVKDNADFKTMSQDLMKEAAPKMGSDLVLYGTTKIFLKIPAETELFQIHQEKMKKKIAAANKLQKFWRRYLSIRKVKNVMIKAKKTVNGIRTIQNLYRVGKEYKQFQKLRKSIRKLQRAARVKLARNRMKALKKGVLITQGWWKRIFLMRKFNKIRKAATLINRVVRGMFARLKLKRLRLVQDIVEELLNRGTALIFRRTEERAALSIQRVWRGHHVRVIHAEKVLQAKNAKINFIFNKNATVIQRTMRMILVRIAISRLHKTAYYIQGFVRMKWLSNTFRELRHAARIIQRAARKWMIYRAIIRERLEEFLMDDQIAYESNRMAEYGALFADGQRNGYDSTNDFNYGSAAGGASQIKEVTPYSSKKISLIVKILDLDVLTDLSDIYDPLWSTQALQLQKEVVQGGNEIDLQLLEVGESHTIAVSNQPRVYSWGWNDHFQLGRNKTHRQTIYHCQPLSFPTTNFRPKQVAAGDEHSVLLDSTNNLYIWGSNHKGQLGLGHTKQVDRINLIDFTDNDPVVDIKARGHNTLAVTESGAAYYWPVEKDSGEVVNRPVLLHIPNKIPITHSSCGHNFAVLVSKNGLVYSFGKDNSAGQLGFGDTYPRDTPTLIQSIRNDGEKVTQAFCGFKHVICRTSLGKIYVWGWGSCGQLGLGEFENQHLPCQVNLTSLSTYQKSKVLQVQAGYRHSIILLDNKRVCWAGTNGSVKGQGQFIELSLSNKIPEIKKTTDFVPVRLLSTWSRTMSVTYITIADCRTLDAAGQVRTKLFSTLIQKFEECCALNDMDPPYVESVSKHFTAKLMPLAKGLPASTGVRSESEKRKRSVSRSSTTSLNQSAMHSKNKSVHMSSRGLLHNDGYAPSPQKTVSDAQSRQSGMFDSIKKSEYGSISGNGRTSQGQMPGEILSTKSSNYFSQQNSDMPNSNGAPHRSLRLELNWNEKITELRRKLDEILAIPREKWTHKDMEFMKLATEPKMLNLLHSAK